MSPLPQRKKSSEEITKLRETLGIIPDGGVHDQGRALEGDASHETAPADLPASKQSRSFKRSERAPVAESPPVAVALVKREPKPVRSLRKSEWAPAEPQPEAPPDSPLPHHRHSDEEIAEIRRREALALMNTQPNAKLFPAHSGIIILGYLSAIAGAAGFYFYQFPIAATLAFVTISVAVATFIGIRKPVSRHHAAFISVMALFVLVFGALHYFPQLRHAT